MSNAMSAKTGIYASDTDPHEAETDRLNMAAPALLEACQDALSTLTEAWEVESDRRQSIRLLQAAIEQATRGGGEGK